jgi:uncharacterized protein (TIGR04255 family)
MLAPAVYELGRSFLQADFSADVCTPEHTFWADSVVAIEIPKPPYPKPPITEGVIHLSVGGLTGVEEQQALVKRLAKDYPHSQALAGFTVTVDTTGGPATFQQQHAPGGFRLTSNDQADVLLVLPNGIAAARLAPYPGWEHLRGRAAAAWS